MRTLNTYVRNHVFLLAQHCSKVNNSMADLQGNCHLWPCARGGTDEQQVRGCRYAIGNIIQITNESIKKLPWRELSCKKLKMGNICPRDKFFTQYLVCLRDYSFQFWNNTVNLHSFSSANCGLHLKKRAKEAKTLVKRKKCCLAWGNFLGSYILGIKYS